MSDLPEVLTIILTNFNPLIGDFWNDTEIKNVANGIETVVKDFKNLEPVYKKLGDDIKTLATDVFVNYTNVSNDVNIVSQDFQNLGPGYQIIGNDINYVITYALVSPGERFIGLTN